MIPSKQRTVHFCLILTLICLGTFTFLRYLSNVQAQTECTPPPSDPSHNGWAQDSIVSYRIPIELTVGQANNLRTAFNEWTNANAANNSGVFFNELTAQGPVQLTVATCNTPGCAPNGAPAGFSLTTMDGTVTGAIVTFDLTQATEDTFFLKLGLHEIGHTMGLDNLFVDPLALNCGGQTAGGSVMNSFCGSNDSANNMPTSVTTCDNTTVDENPQYQPPPDLPGGGDPCDCPCGQVCEDSTCVLPLGGEGDLCTPVIIAVGLSSDYPLTGPEEGVWFDLDADGDKDRTAWTQPGTDVAFLALDRNQNGRIDNGSELFGNHTALPSGTTPTDGFNALIFYDQFANGGNGDGVIDTRDSIWQELLLWIDENHNGYSEPDELYHPETFDLTSISLNLGVQNRSDQHGNIFRLKAPCQLGKEQRFAYDVFFSARPVWRRR